MMILKKLLLIVACIWAVLAPMQYGLISAVCLHWSAIPDAVVVWSCVELTFQGFAGRRWKRWIAGVLVLAAASTIGLFHHFQDQGESAPLPFEWLNYYWLAGSPLLLLSAVLVFIQRRIILR
jgi:hypothetical protein